MLSQIGILAESRWTILATERFLPGVSPLMLLQVRLSGKISLAKLTLKLALFTVRSHVQLFLFQILKCRGTMRALMQRDSRVHLLVFPQHVQLVETGLAIIAFMRRIFIVNLLVLL